MSLIRKQSSSSTNQPLTFFFLPSTLGNYSKLFFFRQRESDSDQSAVLLMYIFVGFWDSQTNFVFTLKTMSPAVFRLHHKDVVLVPLRSCSKTPVQWKEFLYFFPCWDPFCENQPIPPKASAPWLIIKFLLAFGCTSHGFLSASGERLSTPPSCQQGKRLQAFSKKESRF